MSKTLAAMISTLQSEVPAVDSVPSTAQYTQAVKDAVAEFSRRCGLERNAEIAVVSGTANYDLPSDFLDLIEIDDPYDPEHNIVMTETGIIPFSELSPFEEEVTIRDGVLTIYPTPAYSMTRYIEYKAAWVLDGESAYPLTDGEAQIVMIQAKALALEKQYLSIAAAGGMKYSLGAVSVDKSAGADALKAQSGNLTQQFEKACERYNGARRM